MALVGKEEPGRIYLLQWPSPTTKRSRRIGWHVLLLGTAGVLVAPMAQALARSGPAAAAPSNADPNGVLKDGFDLNNEFSNDFAPATEQNDCSFTVTSNIYQSMGVPGNSASPVVWPRAGPSPTTGRTITYHIRPGLEFSNGQPVTSADVAASLNHTKTSPLRSSLFAISNIQTPDASTVVVNLSKPTAGDFLWASSYIDGQIYPSNAISTQSSQPMGSGPYVLKSYRQGSSIVLAKNPKYWDSKAYPLGGIDFTQVTQGPEAATALTSGAVDMIEVEPENYPQLKGDSNIGISVTKSYDYMDMELRQNTGPFANEKVRSAFEYAADRAALNKVVFDGLGEPAYQPVPSWSPGYSKSHGVADPYSPSKAKAMLKAAGYPKGVKFTLIIPSGDATYARAAALLQPELATSGFTANLQQIPWCRLPHGRLHQEAGRRRPERGAQQRAGPHEQLRGALRVLRFPGQRARLGQPATDPADRAGQRISQPEPAGTADAADRQDSHPAGPVGPAGLHAVDRGVQQEPGRRERRRSDRAVPLGPGRHLHQEVAHRHGCGRGSRRADDVLRLGPR